MNIILFLKSLLEDESYFLNYYFFNCIDPPIFSSLVNADFDAKSASILILSLISPVPKILSFLNFLFIKFNFLRVEELSTLFVSIVFCLLRIEFYLNLELRYFLLED